MQFVICAVYTDCAQYSDMQGEVDPKTAAEIAGQLYKMGCSEVSMGDTIGVGTAASVAEMFKVQSSLAVAAVLDLMKSCPCIR